MKPAVLLAFSLGALATGAIFTAIGTLLILREKRDAIAAPAPVLGSAAIPIVPTATTSSSPVIPTATTSSSPWPVPKTNAPGFRGAATGFAGMG
ncbi:MAG: hypothetical protein A2V88_04385 [Elusimicrobia bacterium RBG_16_66_12]|nr:MAG: hypothetical protein A2V88_04385 [Elusimicrobia bacterium RBG_16_66_12]